MQKNCVACRSNLTFPFYVTAPQPLMALNLPRTKTAAADAYRYPMNFYGCANCGHIFNIDFDVTRIPYADDQNLMYNQGEGWQRHLEQVAALVTDDYRHQYKTILDIGAGDGGFLEMLRDKCPTKRFIAFEPGVESVSCQQKGLETYADYFIPARDLKRFKPDVIICRHVLEHMQQPSNFVAELAYYARYSPPLLIAEVPCIDNCIRDCRIADFLYEHISNFTLRSLHTMFDNTGWMTKDIFTAYNGEVIVWAGQPCHNHFVKVLNIATKFNDYTTGVIEEIHQRLANEHDAGHTIALWGGTGKGAAFINAYQLTQYRVIDSDSKKCGRFVPGTGQLIEQVHSLLGDRADIIVITTRWRAADIYGEIIRKGIPHKSVLVLDGLQFREYTKDDYDKEA